ncbi:MAG TPA: phenylalanine--tRNA ligase subunit beta [Pyrinomonadaceae bacterium]|nr:phenylalanine--tRNA ligase subunit beta [Pyrinomonadaceae bacterium]
MPIVNIDTAWLNQLLGREFPAEVLNEALEQMGCDVEDLVELSIYRCPRCQNAVEGSLGVRELKTCTFCGHESETPFEEIGARKVIRLDLLAARPDLFDVGGLARALKGFLGLADGLPDYKVKPANLTVHVAASLGQPESYRPFISCAVMNVPPLTSAGLVAIMELQENLHWGVGRNRKLASIGVYDLDTLKGDIHYRTLEPDGERFTPLGVPGEQMTGREILEKHPKGMAYAHLLADSRSYPALSDERGQVLSMPPIINSEETKLKVGTSRLFIDVTGISEAAVVKSMNTLVCSLMELGGETLAVTIKSESGERITPELSPGEIEIDLPSSRGWLGIPFTPESLVGSLRKMRLDVEPLDDVGERFRVRYPAFRTDIRHKVDLFEDLAIGYGYLNIEPHLIPTMTVGQAREEELLSENVRGTLLGLGYAEVMSLPLTTEEEHFLRFRREVPEHYPRVANPKLVALKVVRTHLLSGVLQALYENRKRPMPLNLFEIDNVVVLDGDAETGVREERRVAFVEMGPEAGYAKVRSVFDAILREMGQQATYSVYDDPAFIPGRSALAVTSAGFEGFLGELHPEVITAEAIQKFGLAQGLDYPVAVGELTIWRVL